MKGYAMPSPAQKLNALATTCREFFKWVGIKLAHLLDIWYWIKELFGDYIIACYNVLEAQFKILTSWFWIFVGWSQTAIWDPIAHALPKNGDRILLGSITCVIFLIAGLEPYTNWLTRACAVCKKWAQEESKRNEEWVRHERARASGPPRTAPEAHEEATAKAKKTTRECGGGDPTWAD